MEMKELMARIDKKKADIARKEKALIKHQARKNEESFIKFYSGFYRVADPKHPTKKDLLNAIASIRPGEGEAEIYYNMRLNEYYEDVESDIEQTNRDLEENKKQLNKYQDILDTLVIETSRREDTEKFPAIVEFLDGVKAEEIDYIHRNLEMVRKYWEQMHLWEKAFSEGAPRERLRKIGELEDDYKAAIHPLTSKYLVRTGKGDEVEYSLDEKGLDECMTEIADNRYWELISRIEETAGKIVDATALDIGPKGNLEGIVVGDREKVYVRTIIAGGENTDVIVNVKHGPIAHYRTIVTIMH